ncbi:TRAP transporter small permease subunit [Chloroflexota bacterium]
MEVDGKKQIWHIESIAKGFGGFSGWLVPVMVVLVFYEVIMRYVVGRPPVIAEEFSSYLLVAVAFLGMAYTWREGGHVRVTAFVEKLPIRVANRLRLVRLIIALVFVLGLTYLSYVYLASSFQMGMRAGSWIRTPLQGPQMTILIGFALLSLLLIVEIKEAITKIRSGK